MPQPVSEIVNSIRSPPTPSRACIRFRQACADRDCAVILPIASEALVTRFIMTCCSSAGFACTAGRFGAEIGFSTTCFDTTTFSRSRKLLDQAGNVDRSGRTLSCPA